MNNLNEKLRVEYSLEVEKAKSKRRIEELTAELSVLRNNVHVKETAEKECQTERNTAHIAVQAIAEVTSCSTAVDQDMPNSPDMIFLQDQVRKLNVELAEARANAEGFSNPLQEKIDTLKEKVSKSEELAAKIVGFETELNTAIADKNAKTEQIEKLNSEHNAVVAVKNELLARVETLEKELESVRAATTAKSEDFEKLKLESNAAQQQIHAKDELIQNLNLEIMKLSREPSSSFKKPRLSDMGICDVTDVSDSSAVEISIKEDSHPLMSRTEMSELGILDAGKIPTDLSKQEGILRNSDSDTISEPKVASSALLDLKSPRISTLSFTTGNNNASADTSGLASPTSGARPSLTSFTKLPSVDSGYPRTRLDNFIELKFNKILGVKVICSL